MTDTLFGLTIGERRLLELIAINGWHRPWVVELDDLARQLGAPDELCRYPGIVLARVFQHACIHLYCCPVGPLIERHYLRHEPRRNSWALTVQFNRAAARALRFLLPPLDTEQFAFNIHLLTTDAQIPDTKGAAVPQRPRLQRRRHSPVRGKPRTRCPDATSLG